MMGEEITRHLIKGDLDLERKEKLARGKGFKIGGDDSPSCSALRDLGLQKFL
jgi:hypothetical protein